MPNEPQNPNGTTQEPDAKTRGLESALTAERDKRQAAESRMRELETEAQSRIADKKKADDTAMVEQQKFKELSEKYKGERDEREQQLTMQRAENQRLRVSGKVASLLPGVNPEYIDKFFPLSEAKLDKDGAVDDEWVKQTTETMKARHPALFSTQQVKQQTRAATTVPQGGPPPNGATGSDGGSEKSMTAAQWKQKMQNSYNS